MGAIGSHRGLRRCYCNDSYRRPGKFIDCRDVTDISRRPGRRSLSAISFSYFGLRIVSSELFQQPFDFTFICLCRLCFACTPNDAAHGFLFAAMPCLFRDEGADATTSLCGSLPILTFASLLSDAWIPSLRCSGRFIEPFPYHASYRLRRICNRI